ncbi:hypothetical protein PSTT_07911 [Puccinia striiformis]|uniref:Reverse transcriptase domain-containing protein n=1 Tax=Puccinia striiformis TaxID=27350 RepID=A0A2S4VEN2_9BASI|nr:hypothetical protein PSTT_07911 [Puccinia striiformis]
MLPRYRLCRWKGYRDRVLKPPAPPEDAPPLLLEHFMSWNVNGIKTKLPMLKQLLQENNVSVAGVQEHLRTVCQYAPGVKNYNIFERPSEKGFRGHCLYIHTSLAAHEIQSTCKHIIYVKIFGLFGDKPWHIFSVYMPSGNLRRKDRTEVWSHFKALLLPLQKDGESLITLMGDFNQDQDTVSRILDRGNIRCLHLKLTSDPSSNSTRRVHEEEGQYIDHFINSPAALKCASTAKVDNISTDLSDHWPIFLNHNTISKDTTRTQQDDINTEEDLTNAASKWVEILNATGEELGLLSVPKEQQTQHFDRATKAAITRSRKNPQGPQKGCTQTGLSCHEQASKDPCSQGKSESNQDNAPCFNMDKVLVTSPGDILRARAAYSEQLAADPTGISQDPSRWTHIKPSTGPFEPLHISRVPTKNIDDDDPPEGAEDRTPPPPPSGLDADAFLMAIRQMKRNAAPGKSGVLAVHLKKFLEVECQLQITKDWENAPQNAFGDKSYPKQLDYSHVALDRWSLPSDLMTPPLIHLLNIMRGCIKLKTQPALWNEEVLITLPKPGQDPRLLENTRGITLSCTEGKFLLTILARDVSSKLESEGFFTDAQAGFRCGQEAMAHVITLNEISKRRRNSGMDTYVIYIDFKKAFDRVPHEGLWAKLLQIGIHPDLVQIIRKGYDNSTIQCRLGEDLSQTFTQKIGTRQGCPLSPLLFIIFVNDILEKVTKGITVPGLTKPAKGLLFADNTLIFADSPSEAQAICDKLDAYCADWHFALGHKKCGVVRYGCEPTADVESEDITYILKEGTIQTVPTYKYLGCLIPNTVLPEDPYPVETEHAKLLAKKAENTMHMSLPILYDKDLHPLTKARVIQSYIMAVGSYGAEWIAMCQKRTRTIQVVLDKASKICFGLKEANKTVNTLLLSLELGVTPLSIHCTLQRIRLWNKGPKLGTLLKDLIKFPHPGKEGTWASNTLTNIKKLTNQESTLKEDDEEGDPLATHHTLTWIASMRKNRLDLHPKHPSPIGTNERVSPEQKEQLAQLETFHVTLLEKEVRREAKKKPIGGKI